MLAPFLQILVEASQIEAKKFLNRFSLVWSRTLASTVRQKQWDHFPDSVCGVDKKELMPKVFPTQPCVRSYEGSCLRNSYHIYSHHIQDDDEAQRSTQNKKLMNPPLHAHQHHSHKCTFTELLSVRTLQNATTGTGCARCTAVQKRALGSLQKHVSPLVQVLLPLCCRQGSIPPTNH